MLSSSGLCLRKGGQAGCGSAGTRPPSTSQWCRSVLRQQRQENEELADILSHILSLGPDWNTQDLASKIKGEGGRLEMAQWVEMSVTKCDKLNMNPIPGAST